ncbi:hypothetical protein AB0M23_26165 [Streptomyces sp. NPDC052077]|uniref:hypothetical protein n=1 Tax=Streptomyces sp. NPDC052077 TaxID=3154757 RepID=UPI00342B2830
MAVTASPTPGGPEGPRPSGSGLLRRLRARAGPAGPRHPRHLLSLSQLDALAVPVGDDGVVVGVGTDERPAVLGVHRPAPFDILFIGGLWTAQVLALRVAATGSRVAVETGRPEHWAQVVRAVGGGESGMTVHDVGRVPPQGASAMSPVLVVRDCGMRPPRGRVTAAPWQSVLTVLPYLSPVAPRLMRQARLTGVQRVSPDEAARIGREARLPRDEYEALPTLADGVTLWCAGRERRYVMTRPTDAEAGLLGAPRRMD